MAHKWQPSSDIVGMKLLQSTHQFTVPFTVLTQSNKVGQILESAHNQWMYQYNTIYSIEAKFDNDDDELAQNVANQMGDGVLYENVI